MTIACFLLPDFPAWAFIRSARPSQPLIVVERDRVVAATRGARRRGVEPGLPLGRATALVPQARVRVRDRGLEAAAWEDVLQSLNARTPYLESPRPGEAYARPAAAPPADAARAWDALAEETGARVGLGPERATARLAAERAGANRVLAIDPASRGDFLERYDVARLAGLGFGEEILERMPLFGYRTLGRATALTRRQLEAQFGEDGARLHDLLHPAGEPPVGLFQPPPTLTAEVEFDEPCRQPGELLPALDPLAEELTRELQRVAARRVTVRVEPVAGEPRSATRILFEAASDPRRIRAAARPLLMDLLGADVEVGRLSLELGALRPAVATQGGLFQERPSVYMAARGVHRRFPGAVRRAVVVYAQFPEDRVQFQPFAEPPRRARAA
jgi:protein ImuB